MPAERLSSLYIQWFAHLDAMCIEHLLEKCVRTKIYIVVFVYCEEIKGFANLL